MVEESAISPYTPQSEIRGLTPIRHQFASHNFGLNDQQYPTNPPVNRQTRRLPPLHQLPMLKTYPQSYHEAYDSGFLVFLNAIRRETVPHNSDIIRQLAGLIPDKITADTDYEKYKDKTYVTFPSPSMSTDMMTVRDVLNQVSGLEHCEPASSIKSLLAVLRSWLPSTFSDPRVLEHAIHKPPLPSLSLPANTPILTSTSFSPARGHHPLAFLRPVQYLPPCLSHLSKARGLHGHRRLARPLRALQMGRFWSNPRPRAHCANALHTTHWHVQAYKRIPGTKAR